MDILLQNPWWKNRTEIEIDEKVKEALQKKIKVLYESGNKKNKIILGPRQVGKTSMLKLLIYDLIINKNVDPMDICYFSCEPLRTKNDIIDLVKEYGKLSPEHSFKYIFLDEITQIPEWELAIKHVLETSLSRQKTITATGSNAMLLKKGSERLPGRNISIELFLPLTFKQYLARFGPSGLILPNTNISNLSEIYNNARKLLVFSDEIESHFNLFLKTGGYLKAIYELLEKRRISEETYEIYIRWILGDISRLERNEQIFKSVLMGIIKNYGTKFSLHSIAKETEIKSHVTVAEYLDILQSLLSTNQLYQLDYNKKIPLFRKEKKNYFIDPFLYSVCKGYTAGKYQDYSDDKKESLIEGVVCEDLARSIRQDIDISSSLWFYLKKKETDFVFKKNNELIGIEVKYQNKADKRDFNNFNLFRKRILLSKNDLSFNDNFLIIPIHLFLSLI